MYLSAHRAENPLFWHRRPRQTEKHQGAIWSHRLAWFEELDQFDGPEEVRSVEQSVFRGGSFTLAFKSFNPPASGRSWANRYALEQRPGKLVHHSTYRDLPPAWLGERFLADAAHLEQTNPTAFRHEYLGEAVGCGTAVFGQHPAANPDDRTMPEL